MSRRELAEAEEDAAMPEIDSAALASGGGASWPIFFMLRVAQTLIRQLRIRRRLDPGRHIDEQR